MCQNPSKLLIWDSFLNRVGAWGVGEILQKFLWSRSAMCHSFSYPKRYSCTHCQLCITFIHIPKQRQNLHLVGKRSIGSSTVDIFHVHLLCVDWWTPITWRIKADFQQAIGENFQLFEASGPITSCSQVNWFLWNAFFCNLDRSGLTPSQTKCLSRGAFLKMVSALPWSQTRLFHHCKTSGLTGFHFITNI